MAELYLTVSPEWNAKVNDWAETLLECTRCGRDFYEIDNIGSWRCSQHVAFRPTGGWWPCCGQKFISATQKVAAVCVAADHRASLAPWDEEQDLHMPLPLANVVRLYDASRVPLPGGGSARNNLHVRRFDWKGAGELGRDDPFPRFF